MPLGQWSGHIWPLQTDNLPDEEVGSEESLKLKASWDHSLSDKRKSIRSSAWAITDSRSHACFESETHPRNSRSNRRQSQNTRSNREKHDQSWNSKRGQTTQLRDKQEALLAKQNQVIKTWSRPSVAGGEQTDGARRHTYISPADLFPGANDSELEDSSWHAYQKDKIGQFSLYDATVQLTEVEVSTSMVRDVVERFQRAYQRSSVAGEHATHQKSETLEPGDMFAEEDDDSLVALSKDAVAAYGFFGKMESRVHCMEDLLQQLILNLDGTKAMDEDMTELEMKRAEAESYQAWQSDVLFGGLAFIEGMSDVKDTMAQAKVKQTMDHIFELLSELSKESERIDFDAWLALIKEDDEMCQGMIEDFNFAKEEVKRLLTVSHLETDEALHNRILLAVLTFTRWFDKVRRAADHYEEMIGERSDVKTNNGSQIASQATRKKDLAGQPSQTPPMQTSLPLDVGYIPDYHINLTMPEDDELDRPTARRLLLTRLTELREKTRRKLQETSVMKLTALKDNVSEGQSSVGPRTFREPKAKKKAAYLGKDRRRQQTVIITENPDDHRGQAAKAAVLKTIAKEQSPAEHKSQPKQVAVKRSGVEDRITRLLGIAKANHDDIHHQRQTLQNKEARGKDLIIKAFLRERIEKRRLLRQNTAPFWAGGHHVRLDERPSPGRSVAIYGTGESLSAARDDEDTSIKKLLFQQSSLCSDLNQTVVKVELKHIWTGEEGKYLRSRGTIEKTRKPKGKDRGKNKDKYKGMATKHKDKREPGRTNLAKRPTQAVLKTGALSLTKLLADSLEEEAKAQENAVSDSSESEEDDLDLSKLPAFLSPDEIQMVLADAIDKRDDKLDKAKRKIEQLVAITCKQHGERAWAFDAEHLATQFYVNPWQLLVPSLETILQNFISKGGYNWSREDQTRLKDMRAQLNRIKGQMSDELLLKDDANNTQEHDAAEITDWASEEPMQELIRKAQALHVAVQSRLKRAAIPEIRERLIPELEKLHPEIQKTYAPQRPRSKTLRGSTQVMTPLVLVAEDESPETEVAPKSSTMQKFKAAVTATEFSRAASRAAEEDRTRSAEEKIERLEAKLERTAEDTEREQLLIEKFEHEKAASAELVETLKQYHKIQAEIQNAKDELIQLRFRSESQERQKLAFEATRKPKPSAERSLQQQSPLSSTTTAEASVADKKAVSKEARPRLRFTEDQAADQEQPQGSGPETESEKPSFANRLMLSSGGLAAAPGAPSSAVSDSSGRPGIAAAAAVAVGGVGFAESSDDDGGGRGGARLRNATTAAQIQRKMSIFFMADVNKKLEQAFSKHKDKDLTKPMRESQEANKLVSKIAATRREGLHKMLQSIASKYGLGRSSFESMKQKLSRWDSEMKTTRANLAAASDLQGFWQQRASQWIIQLREEYSDAVALLVAGRDEYPDDDAWRRSLENALVDAVRKKMQSEGEIEASRAVPENTSGRAATAHRTLVADTGQESEDIEAAAPQPRFMAALLRKAVGKLPTRPAAASLKRTPSWDLVEDSRHSSEAELAPLFSVHPSRPVAKGPLPGVFRAPVQRELQVDSGLAIDTKSPEPTPPVLGKIKVSDDSDFGHGLAMKLLKKAFLKQKRLADSDRDDTTMSSEERRKRFDSAGLEERGGSSTPGKSKRILLLVETVDDLPRVEANKKSSKSAKSVTIENNSKTKSQDSEETKKPAKVMRLKNPHENNFDVVTFSSNTVLTSEGFVEMETITRQKQSDGSPSSLPPVNLSDAESEKDLCRNVSAEEPGLLLLRKFRRRLFKRYVGAEEAFNHSVFGSPSQGLSKNAFHTLAQKLRFDDDSSNNILYQAALVLGLQELPEVLNVTEFVHIVKFASPIKSLGALQRRLEQKYGSLTHAFSAAAGHRQMDGAAFRLLLAQVGGSRMEADAFFSEILTHCQGQVHIERQVFQLVLRSAEGLQVARRLIQALGLKTQLEQGEEGKAQAFQSVVELLEQKNSPSQPLQIHEQLKHFGFCEADSDALLRLGGAIPASCLQKKQTRVQDVALAAVAGLGQRAEQLATHLGKDFFSPTQPDGLDDEAAKAWRYKKCHYVPLAMQYGYGNGGIAKRFKKMLAAEAVQGFRRATGNQELPVALDLVAGSKRQSERRKTQLKGEVKRGSVVSIPAIGEEQANAKLEVSACPVQGLSPECFSPTVQEHVPEVSSNTAVPESGSLATPDAAEGPESGSLAIPDAAEGPESGSLATPEAAEKILAPIGGQKAPQPVLVEAQPKIAMPDHELDSKKHVMLQQLQAEEAEAAYIRRLRLFGGDQMQIQSAVRSMQELRNVILNKLRGPCKGLEKLAGVGKESLPLSKMHEKALKVLSLTPSNALRLVALLETFDESPNLDLPKLIQSVRFGAAVPNMLEFKKVLVQGYGSAKFALDVCGLIYKQEFDVGIMQKALAPFGIAEGDAHRIFQIADIAQPGGQRHELSSRTLSFALEHAHILTWLESLCRRSLSAGTNAANAVLDSGPPEDIADVSTFEEIFGPLGFPSQFMAATFEFFRHHGRGKVTLPSVSELLRHITTLSEVKGPSAEQKSGSKASASNIPDEEKEAGILATRKLNTHFEQTGKNYKEGFSYLSGKSEENNSGMNLQQWMEAVDRSGFDDPGEWELLFAHMTDWRHVDQSGMEIKVHSGNLSKSFEEAKPCRSLVEFRDRLQKKFGSIQKAWSYIAEKDGAGEVLYSRWQSALATMSVPADDAGQLLALIQAIPYCNVGSQVSHSVIQKKTFFDAMAHAEVSTKLLQLMERLSWPTGETARTVTKAFEKLCYDKTPLSPTKFQQVLAEHFEVRDHDARQFYRVLDVYNDETVTFDDFFDLLVAMQSTYLPFRQVTFMSKTRQMISKQWLQTRSAVKAKLALSKGRKSMVRGDMEGRKSVSANRFSVFAPTDAPVEEEKSMSPNRFSVFAPIDAHVEGRKSVSASRFTPTNVLADIVETDIESCRPASVCGAVPESSTSSRSGVTSTALTSASTALPADSDSEDDARNAARPWSSMSATRVVSTGAAIKRLQTQQKMRNQRQSSAWNDSRGPSPLPQLDLASSLTIGSRPSPRQPQPKAKRLPRLLVGS